MSVIAGRTVKKFAIVGFIEEDNIIEVIPSTWILNASETKWPTLLSRVLLTKYIKQCRPLDKDWKALKIRIHGFSNTYKGAQYKADLAEDHSNLESDSSDSMKLKKRKSKKPARYQTDTSASENESNLKKESCITLRLKEKSDSILNGSSRLRKRRRKKPSLLIDLASDPSASENEYNLKKESFISPRLSQKSDSALKDSLLLKRRMSKKPVRYRSSDTSSSETESNLKKNCIDPNLRKKMDFSLDGNLFFNPRKRKGPTHYQSTDKSASESESNKKKENCIAQKRRDLAKRKRLTHYQSSVKSASETESNKKKENCVTQKRRKKSDSTFDINLPQRIHKMPARYQTDYYTFPLVHESNLKKAFNQKLKKGSDSIAKDNEQSTPFTVQSKEQALNKSKSTKEKKRHMSSESNETSTMSVSSQKSTPESDSENTSFSENVTSQKAQNPLDKEGSEEKLNQIWQYLKQIHEEIKELNSKYDNISCQLSRLSKSANDFSLIKTCLPMDIDLPITSEDTLMKLNNKLKLDKEFCNAMVDYLLTYGNGKGIQLFLLSIAKTLLSPELAICYSISHKKGKKSLLKFPEILNVILTATTLKFKNFIRKDFLVFEMFDKHLAEARDWLGKE